MIPDRLRSEALVPLWRKLHERLSSGRTVTSVRFGPLDDPERAALADLLGMTRYPGQYATVSLTKLDSALLESAGTDSRTLVTEILGPLDDRAARRARDGQQRAELWDWLAAHDVVTAQPALREWAEQVRRAGIVNSSVDDTREMLESTLRVLRALPTEGMPLPAFAETVLGDPHALDETTRVSGLVLRALATIYGTDVPAGAEQRRALWERAGVADDELSTVVLAAGLRPGPDSLPQRIMLDCADTGHAAALTLGQLRACPELAVAAADVCVVENPSILALALRRFGTACPPLVCTSGWPNSAGIMLLRLLAADGARLHYHGDIDGEGIRIAAYVMDKTGARPWRMGTDDYLAACQANQPGPAPGRVTEAPWDPALAGAVREHGVALVEERASDALLQDLGTAIPLNGKPTDSPAVPP